MANKKVAKKKTSKRKRITLNNKPTETFQKIIVNFTGVTRHDSMDGKDYLVAPMVMIVEGVLQGSNGPLLYPANELAKTPEVWNMKPVVVYHPKKDGRGVTACDPDIIKNHGVGLIMHAKFEDSKLKAEAWIDINKAGKVDERVIEAIKNNTVMELSTGLFTDNEKIDGEFNGIAYEGIARNYRPDHLALLPDLKGACSIKDGAGFLRLNVSNAGTSVEIDLKKTPVNLEGMNWLAKNAEMVTQALAELIFNEMSHSDIWTLISSKLRESNDDLWIDEVFDTFFIYADDGVLYKQNYSINDGEVTFIGGREKVTRSIVFRTEDGSIIGNKDDTNRKDLKMNKDQLVDVIIANACTQWAEEHKDALMAMEEDMLKKMLPVENEETEAVKNAAKKAADEALALNENEETTVENKEKTADQIIANIGNPEVAAMLTNGMNSYKADKAKLIGIIIANEKNIFTEDQLKLKEIGELKGLASLASNTKEQIEKVKALNFEGQGDPVGNTDEKEEGLPLPVLNFDAEKKKIA